MQVLVQTYSFLHPFLTLNTPTVPGVVGKSVELLAVLTMRFGAKSSTYFFQPLVLEYRYWVVYIRAGVGASKLGVHPSISIGGIRSEFSFPHTVSMPFG